METKYKGMLAVLIAGTCLTGVGHAQEAMYTAAATMPSKNTFVLRPQLHVYQFGTNPSSGVETTRKYEFATKLDYGLARAWSMSLEVPVVYEEETLAGGESEDDIGVEDLDLMFKYRVYKNDSGGVDTLRIALMAGAKITSGDSAKFASQSVNPHAGIVLTLVRGRWGFNQEFSYTFNTGGSDATNFGGDGPSDAFAYNSALLYRIDPPFFTPTSKGAWYVTGEMVGLYETNGDNEIRFAPGLMYEGTKFAFELMAQLPVYDSLSKRAELDWGLGVGFRFAF
jgi:hypothetical protein